MTKVPHRLTNIPITRIQYPRGKAWSEAHKSGLARPAGGSVSGDEGWESVAMADGSGALSHPSCVRHNLFVATRSVGWRALGVRAVGVGGVLVARSG